MGLQRAMGRRLLSLLVVLGCTLGVPGLSTATELSRASLVEGQFTLDQDGHVDVGGQGAEFELEHGARVLAEPGTRFSLGRSFKLSLGTGDNSHVPTRVLSIYSGRLEILVPRTQPISCAVLIVGPGKDKAINRGGRSSVRVSKNGLVWAAHQYSLMFGTGGAWRHLKEGELQVVSKIRPRGKSWKLPVPVHGIHSSASLLLQGPVGTTQAMVGWDAVPGTTHYELSVRDSKAGLVSRMLVNEPRGALRGLGTGRFVVRARAVHSSGVAGAWSKSISLNVIKLSVAGASVGGPDGIVWLLPGQRVQLQGAEGLEITYVGVNAYLPAPTSLGLVARRPISLELRHSSGKNTLAIRLEPLTVSATIKIERSPSSWPRLGLPVEIQLTESSGAMVPDSRQFEILATVNLEPAVAQWQREPGVIKARIARPSGSGPWVVRLEVLDATGRRIGRDVRDIGYAGTGRRTATK